MKITSSLHSLILDSGEEKLVAILQDAQSAIANSGLLILSLTGQGRKADILASASHQAVISGEVEFPAHILELLYITDCSAPVPAKDIMWPDNISHWRQENVVCAPLRNNEEQVVGLTVLVTPRHTLTHIEKQHFLLVQNRVTTLIEQGGIYKKAPQELNHKIELLNEIGAISKTGGWEYWLESQYVAWTDETYRLFGMPKGASVSVHRALANFPRAARKQLIGLLRQAATHGRPFKEEMPFYGADGKSKWVNVTARVRKRDGKISQVFGSIQDVTEQRRLSDTEHNYTTYLAAILDNLNDAVITIDTSGTIITANQTVEKIFGYSADDLVGMDVSVLMPEPFSDQHAKFMGNYLTSGEAKILGYGRELTARHFSGRTFPVELSLSEVFQDDQRQFVGIVRDITERKQATDNMYRLAYIDDITNLPNFRSFEQSVRELIDQARESRRDIYCCMLDIDNFAQYNLSFGKETGDYILRVIAGRIKRTISGDFKAYRGLADRFFVLFTTPLEQDDKQTLEKLNSMEWSLFNEVLSEMTLHGHSQMVTASISAAHIQGDTASYEKVIGVLEFGRKRAKGQGQGGRVSLERSAFADYERHNYISQSFARALSDGEFFLVLQPQFDEKGRIVCSEALLRWNHDSIGMISPGEFIPIAEESDAVVDIGYWVIDEACRILAKCQANGMDTTLAVNISGRHIARADFSQKLMEITSHWGISPHNLVLEITETTLVSSIDLVRQRIEILSNYGFAFSIDDFGTGYSSLSYLKELPITELKIDRYFVDEINFADDDVPIVNTIIDMAHAMGVRTVAEGIENDIQLNYLRKRGCGIFQGFYLGRPIPEDDWWQVLSTNLSGKTKTGTQH